VGDSDTVTNGSRAEFFPAYETLIDFLGTKAIRHICYKSGSFLDSLFLAAGREATAGSFRCQY
jgi:hypothetical protein